jgi:NAD-dependent SIR2 family protein deacetylase
MKILNCQTCGKNFTREKVHGKDPKNCLECTHQKDKQFKQSLWHRGQKRALKIVYDNVVRGHLPVVNTLNCVDCGQQAEAYDHRDYNYPLLVVPVCRYCNAKRGKAIEWRGYKKDGYKDSENKNYAVQGGADPWIEPCCGV